MTKLLKQAVEKVQALPADMQDQAARMLLAYAGDEELLIELTPEEEADLIEAQAEMARGEFASEAEVEARIAAIVVLLQIQPRAGLITRVSGVRRIFLTPYPYLIDYYAGDDEI